MKPRTRLPLVVLLALTVLVAALPPFVSAGTAVSPAETASSAHCYRVLHRDLGTVLPSSVTTRISFQENSCVAASGAGASARSTWRDAGASTR